jgi:hypothetical protein
MYLSAHSNVGNNNFFVKLKINHKVSNLLMHPCCGILFYVMSGFIQMPKGIENQLKMYLEN